LPSIKLFKTLYQLDDTPHIVAGHIDKKYYFIHKSRVIKIIRTIKCNNCSQNDNAHNFISKKEAHEFSSDEMIKRMEEINNG
jgi:hypothetical protein